MAYLYIANCTQQAFQFIYRLPERPGEFHINIPAGSQSRLAHDLSGPDIDAVLEQHRRYGLVEVKTQRIIGRQYAPLCYSVGIPVKLENIQLVLQGNTEVLVERGRKIREEAGVAIHHNLDEMMQRERMPDRLVQMEASIQEDSRDPTFAEGVRVSHDVEGGERPPVSRRRGGRETPPPRRRR